MKTSIKVLISLSLITAMFSLATPALAYSPVLSVTSQGGDTAIVTVSNADPFASITFYRRQGGSSLWTTITNFGQTDSRGYFSQVANLGFDASNSPVEQYVVINGQQSSTVQTYPDGYSGYYPYRYSTSYPTNCGYYGCNNFLTFSQNNLSLTIGQSATVAIYNYNNVNTYYGSYYISSNSNSYVANANISGNSLYVNALAAGSTSINVCQSSNNSQCATVYVTVSSNVLGASAATVSAVDNVFNPKIITVPVGSSVTWTNNGSMIHTVTADDNSFNSGNLASGSSFSRTFNTVGTYAYHCIYHGGTGGVGMSGVVIVTSLGPGSRNIWFSPSNPTLFPGQSLAVSINSSVSDASYYSGVSAFFVSSNSNPSAVSASVSGTVLNLTGLQNGSANIQVCPLGLNFCGTIYVTVGGSGISGGLYFISTSLPALTVGQYYNAVLQAAGATPPYTFTLVSGSLPFGLNLYTNGQISGVTSINYPTTFSVKVTDVFNHAATADFSLSPTGSSVLGVSIFSNGRLIAEGNTVHIVYKNTKTGFTSLPVFRSLGFSLNNVQSGSLAGLVDSGYVIRTANSSHPWGSWIKSGSTIYFVHESGLIPVPDYGTFVANGGQDYLVVAANFYDFSLPMLSPMIVNDARLQ